MKYRGTSIQLVAKFSSDTRGQQIVERHSQKEKGCGQRILYPAKVFFQNVS